MAYLHKKLWWIGKVKEEIIKELLNAKFAMPFNASRVRWNVLLHATYPTQLDNWLDALIMPLTQCICVLNVSHFSWYKTSKIQRRNTLLAAVIRPGKLELQKNKFGRYAKYHMLIKMKGLEMKFFLTSTKYVICQVKSNLKVSSII